MDRGPQFLASLIGAKSPLKEPKVGVIKKIKGRGPATGRTRYEINLAYPVACDPLYTVLCILESGDNGEGGYGCRRISKDLEIADHKLNTLPLIIVDLGRKGNA